jgi:LDH2 family malate/lactate/ureidoglycolate dehydrogenase
MTSKTELHVISSADLQRFASALFAAAGVAQAMAEEWARSLVWANLRGVDSHGVLRIPGYIERLKSKDINPAPAMRIEKRAGAIAVLEADRAPGAVAMAAAMAEAIARAERPIRLVRSAQHHPCGRRRLFCAAGRERRHGRHRHVGVGPDDGLLRR